jgi:SAM-dependent methyltransferase
MSAEVHGLDEFYASPPGMVAARLLSARLRALWPDLTRLDWLGLGWAAPYAGLWAEQPGRRLLMTPTGLVGRRRPAGALVEEHRLPLPDRSMDRILLVHGLEASMRPAALLRECWRLLRDDGRLIVVAPNRLGSWAQFEHTPFGQGQPYSAGQLERLLEGQLYRVERREAALFIPPFPWRTALRGAGLWETVGHGCGGRRLAGLVVLEAEKDLFAAMPAGAVSLRRRVVMAAPRV